MDDKEKQPAFWVVWCPTSDTPLKHRHMTEVAAIKECEHLAHVNSGAEFIVMKAVASYTRVGVRKIDFCDQS